METILICPFCGGQAFIPRFEVNDYWLERKDVHVKFVQCSQCGLIFQNPRPDRAEMEAHYPQSYEVFAAKGHNRSSFFYRYGWKKRCELITRHKKSGRLLDLGCANGSFLEWMKQTSGAWELYGIEPAKSAAQKAANAGFNVFEGVLEDAHYPDGYFDVITAWDVLEHLADPQKALWELYRTLKVDGLLVLRFPDADSLDARIFGKYWAGIDAPRHLYVFSGSTIARLLEKMGFSILDQNSRVGGYLNFVKSIRFALTAKQVKSAYRNPILKLLSNPLSRVIAAPFFYLKDTLSKGSEIVLIASKKGRNE